MPGLLLRAARRLLLQGLDLPLLRHPYGLFELNMEERINFELKAAS